MTHERAPLYIEAHQLSCWLSLRLHRVRGDSRHELIVDDILQSAYQLLAEIATALTFPSLRREALVRADVCLLRLRVILRVAREVGDLNARRHRYCVERMDLMGRMIGGWRRSNSRRTGNRGRATEHASPSPQPP